MAANGLFNTAVIMYNTQSNLLPNCIQRWFEIGAIKYEPRGKGRTSGAVVTGMCDSLYYLFIKFFSSFLLLKTFYWSEGFEYSFPHCCIWSILVQTVNYYNVRGQGTNKEETSQTFQHFCHYYDLMTNSSKTYGSCTMGRGFFWKQAESFAGK